MPASSSSDLQQIPVKLLRTPTLSKRPNPSALLEGQPALNTNPLTPGLYFRDSTGQDLVKVGPCHVGTSAPNNNPAGFFGHTKGEFWLDISDPEVPQFKVWSGAKWEVIGFPPDGGYIASAIIDGKGDIVVGQSANSPSILPVGPNGRILTADSTQPLGVRWAAPVYTPPVLQTATFTTPSLAPGEISDFSLNFGSFFHLVEAGLTTETAGSSWLRIYTTDSARTSDTRTVPGPPFPCVSTGFAAEAVTSSSLPLVTFLPVPAIFCYNGLFFRAKNQEATPKVFTFTFRYSQIIASA